MPRYDKQIIPKYPKKSQSSQYHGKAMLKDSKTAAAHPLGVILFPPGWSSCKRMKCDVLLLSVAVLILLQRLYGAQWCSYSMEHRKRLVLSQSKPSTTRSCLAWIGHRLWVWSWTHGNPGVSRGSPVSRGCRCSDASSHRGCCSAAFDSLGPPGTRSSWARPWALVPAVPVALCDRTQQALARSWTGSLQRWVACSTHCRPLVERVPV